MAFTARHKRFLLAGCCVVASIFVFREVFFLAGDDSSSVNSAYRYISDHLHSSSTSRPQIADVEAVPSSVPEHDEASQHAVDDAAVVAAPAPDAASPGRTKAIITSTLDKNDQSADWIVDLLPDWTPAIYVTDRKDDDFSRPIPKYGLLYDRGREASVYLTYIINHYYNLPDIMVFIHGNRYQTHNDDRMYDTFPEINNLNLDYVMEEGYTSLRCNWKICPDPAIKPTLEIEDGFWEVNKLYAKAFMEFFPNDTIPEKVAAPCCAQFAVTKETVQKWPITKYEEIRQFIWVGGEAKELSMKMGLVMEFMWHILFGKPTYWCEPAKQCYCKKWNMCDLECPSDGWCRGTVWVKHAPYKFPVCLSCPSIHLAVKVY